MARLRESFEFHKLGEAESPIAPDFQLTGFDVDGQDRTFWCWAATSISVARHILKKEPKFATQCELAIEVVKLCFDCESEDCNKPADIPAALFPQGITVTQGVEQVPSIAAFSTSLGSNRPIICLVKFDPADKFEVPHVVVIRSVTGKKIFVNDPRKNAPVWQRDWLLESFFKDHCAKYYFV